jgi:putative flavoprotein involved in K+ transport
MHKHVHTVVVGGGQAGLALSYHLTQRGLEHVILERARVAENWRSQRWDALVFQFPSWSIKLPGHSYDDGDPEGFASKNAIVGFIQDYAQIINAPLRCGVNVPQLGYDEGTRTFTVDTEDGEIRAVNVVVATGSYHRPIIPAVAASIPTGIFQIHTCDYKNPEQLPLGNVLIVGSGASGVQIAEELNLSGRHVYLSVGRHDKAPRRYRGRDIYWWFEELGIWSRALELQPELKSFRILITGARGGHDIDLRQFGSLGITLLGRLQGVVDARMYFATDLEEKLAQAEKWFSPYKARFDAFAEKEKGKAIGAQEPDHKLPPVVQTLEHIDLNQSKITSIIWATGFRYDYSWIKLSMFDDTGKPQLRRGVSPMPGLYFLGLRRSYSISSGLLPGVGEDAAYIAQHIAARVE